MSSKSWASLTKGDRSVASAGVANCNEGGQSWALIRPHFLGGPCSPVIPVDNTIMQKSAVCLLRDRCVLWVWICLSCLQYVCQHHCSWTWQNAFSITIPYSIVSCQLKEVKKVHQLAHTYRNNFYHVPHYPERACLIDMFAKGLAIEPSGS